MNDSADEEERNVAVRVILQQGPRGDDVKRWLEKRDAQRIIASAGGHLLLLAESIDDAITAEQGKRGETRIELVLSSKDGSSPVIRVGWFTAAECTEMDTEDPP